MKITGIHTLFSREQIATRVNELAKEINLTYGEESFIAICVLQGACIFYADLVRAINRPDIFFDFLRLSSYGDKTESGGIVRSNIALKHDIQGKNVLIVEDIVDSGRSMSFLLEDLKKYAPKSLRLASLIDKRSRRVVDVHVDFAAFTIEDGFIVGYGLDYAQHYRALSDICVLEYTTD